MQRSGFKASLRERAAKTALVFGFGSLFGFVAGHRVDARLPKPVDVVPVHGLEAPGEQRPAPAGAVLDVAERQAPERSAGSRLVARSALSTTVGIRGDGVYGAGVVIASEYVLTCLHVVEKMKQVRVTTSEGDVLKAAIVDRDAKLDLAVLELEKPRETYARLASVSTLEMGDPVYAMGSPRKMSFSLGSGIVSYAGRPYSDLFYVQNDVPTNGGSSGGPLFDESGKVVGISSFILRDSQGLSFALPIDYAVQRFPDYFAERLNPSAFASWLGARAKSGMTDERPPLTD